MYIYIYTHIHLDMYIRTRMHIYIYIYLKCIYICVYMSMHALIDLLTIPLGTPEAQLARASCPGVGAETLVGFWDILGTWSKRLGLRV